MYFSAEKEIHIIYCLKSKGKVQLKGKAQIKIKVQCKQLQHGVHKGMLLLVIGIGFYLLLFSSTLKKQHDPSL